MFMNALHIKSMEILRVVPILYLVNLIHPIGSDMGSIVIPMG
jgi:hypothetical protein